MGATIIIMMTRTLRHQLYKRGKFYLLAVLAVFGDNVPEHADTVVDAAAVLLLDEVVHLALAGFLLGGVGVRSKWRKGRRLHFRETRLEV